MIEGIDKCYYCGKEATRIIEWKHEKVVACTICSEKATGKVHKLGALEEKIE